MSTHHGTHQKSNTPKMWQKANCEPIDKPLDRFDFHTEFLAIFLNHKSAEANWKLIKQLNNSITSIPWLRCPWARHRIPQLLPGRRSNGCPLLRVHVHCVCSLLTAVCVHLDGLNAEHQFRLWVTILDNTSHYFYSEHRQRDAGPTKAEHPCDWKCWEPLYFSGPSRGWGSGIGSYTLQSFPV